MLIRLQFDMHYDIIDVPESLMDMYNKNRVSFYDSFYEWLERNKNKYCHNGIYIFAGEAVLDWLNNTLLKDSEQKVTMVIEDKYYDPDDMGLDMINF